MQGMAKTSVEDFDTDVCMGERADVNGPCPRRVSIDADTGRSAVDRLARAEGKAMDAVGIGEEGDYTDFKCGECGCPLANLALTDQAPEECPRLDKHR